MKVENGGFKTKPQDIIFVTQESITRWLPDPDNPQGSADFLNDCRNSGWPIFTHPDGTSYVYATMEVPL